jgi:ABC-type nitrate/sulfonate/bicarbonate transport system substrate-binding protein
MLMRDAPGSPVSKLKMLATVIVGGLGLLVTPAYVQAQSQKVVIATGADPNFGIFYIASQNGAFKKAGLDVELKTGSSGSAQVPLIITGDVQLAFGSGGACIRNHILKPDKVALFAEGSILNEYDAIVSHDGIANLDALKGKKVGLARGTGSEVFFNAVLAKNNLKNTDFNIVFVDAPEMIAAIERKDIDAYAAWEPWVSRGVASVRGTKVLLTSKGIWSPSSFICGDKEWATKNPDTAKKVMGVLAETAKWANDNREEAAKLISQVIKLDGALTSAITNKVVFRTHLVESSIKAIEDDYKDLAGRNIVPPNPAGVWWQGFIFDKPLRDGAPGNVSFKHPG